MNVLTRIYSVVLCVMFITHIPMVAEAGLREAWTSLVEVVQSGIIRGDADQKEEAEPDGEGTESAEESGSTVSTAAESGMCQVPQPPPETSCELGSGFLCVNTPKRGVAEEWAIISGTIDRANSVVTTIEIVSQHEYTKETVAIDTSDPETTGCWESVLDERPFCLDEQGYFAARIPLSRLGSYAVSVSASRLSGASESTVVRLARVEAPTFTSDQLSFEEGDLAVSVVVELLGDCQFCDYIGANAGAVTVSVENMITAEDGTTQHVSCETNIEQGGQGRFVIGVPLGAGKNVLTIEVCNAATEGACPTVGDIDFTGSSEKAGLEIMSPPPQPAYDRSEYPTIQWKFRFTGASGGCVDVQLNRQAIERVCSDSDVFQVELDPSPGINVVTADGYPWAFGWGEISSPFDEDGDIAVKTGLIARNSVQLAVPARTMTHTVQPIMSNFLSSDSFGNFVSSLLGGAPPTRGTDDTPTMNTTQGDELKQQMIDSIRNSLEGCEPAEGGFMEGKRIEIVGKPVIGKAKFENMRFEKDAFSFTINADDVEASIRLVKDADMDGIPEGDPLPLLISFRKVYIDITLAHATGPDGRDVFLISSPHTDCDYKSDRYCKHMPAPLIPKYFLGSANRMHGFVTCDTDGQQVSEEVEGLCDSLNSLDAQTGVVSEKVLDAINGTLYCTGSSTLTYLMGGGSLMGPLRIGCFPDDPEDRLNPMMGCASGAMGKFLGPWVLSAGVDLGDGLEITEDGIYVTAHLRAGRPELFEGMEKELRIPSVGVMVDPSTGSHVPIASAETDRLMRMAFSTDALNHLFFLLTEQVADGKPSGLLDLDLSAPFFKTLGFDFVEQCDALNESEGDSKQPSPLCNIRPRVGELLGTSLTTYKYFPQNYPLMMRLEGNRALTPHLRIVSLDELPVVSRVQGEEQEGSSDVPTGNLIDFQLGGLTLKFYALEIDEEAPLDAYGNPQLRLDEEGNPIIRSMRPEDDDPDHGQIISFELTLLLALEVGDIAVHSDDPTSLMLTLRPLADRSRLVLTPVPGSNATTVPPEGLVSALREKLSYAISIFSAPEKAIKIPIPKSIGLSPTMPTPDSLFSQIGLKELRLGTDGLSLSWDQDSSFVTIDLSGTILQLFQRGGDIFEEEYPD